MKKTICLILAVFMLLGAVSCSNSIENKETGENSTQTSQNLTEENETSEQGVRNADGVFATGFARETITPEFSVKLAGYGNEEYRMSNNILDVCYATCLCVRDEKGNTSLIYTLDLLSMPDDLAKSALSAVSKKTGVPEESIFLSATHTHEAPSPNDTSPIGIKWRSFFIKALQTTAQNAIKDLDKSEIYAGTVKIENMNFIRRYVDASGKGVGDNYGTGTPVAHESEVDNNAGIIRFKRENAKDIIIVNWAAHPSINGGSTKYNISADYPTYLRNKIEKDEDVLCGFWEGAAGNLNIRGRLQGESLYNEASTYGKALAEKIIEALPSLEKVESGEIKSTKKTLTLKTNHSMDNLIDKATEVRALFAANKTDEAKALASQYGFDSVYTANHILNNKNLPETLDINVYAIKFGDIGFCSVPYEMFDANGKQVKDASPCKLTFICEQTNGGHSYVPSEVAYKYGGYEVTACKFEKGTGEKVANELISMLKSIY